MKRIKHLDSELVNRSKNGDLESIKEAVSSLYDKGLGDLLVIQNDHRWHQGYLHALDTIRELINK